MSTYKDDFHRLAWAMLFAGLAADNFAAVRSLYPKLGVEDAAILAWGMLRKSLRLADGKPVVAMGKTILPKGKA